MTVEDQGDAFVVTFSDVPEFFSTGANSFEIILFAGSGNEDDDEDDDEDGNRNGNKFSVSYGDLSASDGLAGYACPTATAESDLSAFPGLIDGQLTPVVAVYEHFSAFDNDLAGRTIRYNGTPSLGPNVEPTDDKQSDDEDEKDGDDDNDEFGTLPSPPDDDDRDDGSDDEDSDD